MFAILHDRKDRYCRALLCFVIAGILVFCAANGRPQTEKLSDTDPYRVSSIFSRDNGFFVIISGEITGHPEISSIESKKSAAGKFNGSGALPDYAAAGGLFLLTGTLALFLLQFRRDLAASHHFIISYIHDTDGMKP